ncbi:MAG: hypothetical protein V4651_03055 [Bacteroidota bacterium]
MNIYLLNTTIEGKETLLLSIINPETDKNAQLTAKAIVGFVLDASKPISFDNVRLNPAFIDHFHKTIVFFAQFNDGIIHLAEQQQNGFVYINDLRNKEDKEVLKEDIIGSFEVKNGELIHNSYLPNTAYKMITADGGFVLQPELEALIYSTAY